MESRVICIEKLEGPSNWIDWKFQVKIQLQALGLMPAVSGTLEPPVSIPSSSTAERAEYSCKLEAYNKIEYMAQNIIVSSLTPKIRQLINMTTSAKEMWDKLCGVHEQRTEQRQDRLFNQFFGVQEKDPRDNIASHIAKLEKLWTELLDETWKEDKVKLPESLFVNRILNTLPREYLEFTNAWESVPKKDRTVNMLRERLCTMEQRLFEKNLLSNMEGLVVSKKHDKIESYENSNMNNKRKQNTSRRNISCFRCNQVGHYKNQCPIKKGNQNRKFTDNSGGKSGYVGVSVSHIDISEGWVADSGCTQHLTNRREWFSTWEPFEIPRDVFVGNGQKMKALGQGKINAKFEVGKKYINSFLDNVWYVPDAGHNLFSIVSSIDKGMTFFMNNRKCTLMRGGELKAIAERRGGLYYMKLKVQIPQYAAVGNTDTLQIWHERLSHQNKSYVKSYLKHKGIVVKGDEKEICEGCIYGKHHRVSFRARKDQNRGHEPGDIVHGDVCGPMPVRSLGGAKYFVCFKDDFSKFRHVYFLKEKSEVPEKLKDFLNRAKVLGHVIKELLTDGGREFDCSQVKHLASVTGLHHRIVMPYSPEQNGAAERENRTLVEAARSMIHAKNLPEFLWAEAVNTASYVLNRSAPTPVVGKTPIELWTGKAEKFSHLKIFGTECYVHVPSQNRRKWDKKATQGVLVGYCGYDGYRVWVPEKRVVITSKHVTFGSEKAVGNILSHEPKVQSEPVELGTFSNNPVIERGQIQPTVSEARGREVRDLDFTSDPSGFTTPPRERHSVETSVSDNTVQTSDDEGTDNVINPLYSPPCLRDRSKLKRPDYFGVANLAGFDPKNVEEALSSSDAPKWKAAMDDEISSLFENKTWELVNLPPGRKAISNRWVLKRKPNIDGSPGRFKARLVACGYSQKEGIDYDDTYSPVTRFDSVRTVLAVAAKERLHLRQFDVKTAFLYGYLGEEIYMVQPKGYEDGTGRVCKLVKSLYGLKQAPRCWNKRLTNHLKKLGLQQSSADPCLFFRKGEKKLILCLYVDDGLVAGSDKETVEEFLSTLKREFKITTGPLEQYLGINILENTRGIFINQNAYVVNMLNKFGMSRVNPKSTPMEAGFVSSDEESKLAGSRVPYREAIGCLMYLAVATRPDITFAVNHLAQAVENPLERHWTAVKRIFKYLKGTSSHGLFYPRQGGSLEVYCDADYASDPKTRKSVSGVVCCYAGAAITWFSRKQRCTSTSSTEAEYVAGSEAVKEIVWLRQVLQDISDKKEGKPTLWVDNMGAVKLAKNPSFHKLTKHIDVRYHFIREKLEEEVFNLEHISGEEQLADILTKPLHTLRFRKLCQKLGLSEASSRGSVEN